jgi:hypothetical protein
LHKEIFLTNSEFTFGLLMATGYTHVTSADQDQLAHPLNSCFEVFPKTYKWFCPE